MQSLDHRLCTAPMMDWSDRHCRYYFRQLTPHAVLYTEMITAAALMHGNVERHLRFGPAEHPVALQLGGSDPGELAQCAALGESYGYDEINLNCGCPSERVQHGSFGACLMHEPELVAECVAAMRSSVSVPVTVKHRLGVDDFEEDEFVHRFVNTVAQAGCETFIVHARNAILRGLSPRDNRAIPPLRYEQVYRLKRAFPRLAIVINGGIATNAEIASHLRVVDGVMLGRAAYHDSCLLAQADGALFGARAQSDVRGRVVHAMHAYAIEEVRAGTPLRAITRHMLGLFHGHPRARLWRRLLCDPEQLAGNNPQLLLDALAALGYQSLAQATA